MHDTFMEFELPIVIQTVVDDTVCHIIFLISFRVTVLLLNAPIIHLKGQTLPL